MEYAGIFQHFPNTIYMADIVENLFFLNVLQYIED